MKNTETYELQHLKNLKKLRLFLIAMSCTFIFASAKISLIFIVLVFLSLFVLGNISFTIMFLQKQINYKSYQEYPDFIVFMRKKFEETLEDVLTNPMFGKNKEFLNFRFSQLKIELNKEFLFKYKRLLTSKEMEFILLEFQLFINLKQNKNSSNTLINTVEKSLKFIFETNKVEDYMKDASKLKKQYYKMAKKLHPDTETGSKEAFQELQEHYSYLKTHFNY